MKENGKIVPLVGDGRNLSVSENEVTPRVSDLKLYRTLLQRYRGCCFFFLGWVIAFPIEVYFPLTKVMFYIYVSSSHNFHQILDLKSVFSSI